MNKLLILQGPPACGKSTVAKAWQAEDPVHRVIVSRDAIRHARGQYWVPEQENYITSVEEISIRVAMEYGLDICLDATNMHYPYLEKWKNLASIYGYEIEFKIIHATLEECIERDKNADRAHHVGEAVIRKFYNKYLNLINNGTDN